jgi:uncharacterized protein YybS (DUF2232 family)
MLYADHNATENASGRQGWPLKEEWGAWLDRDFILGIVITTLLLLSVVLVPLVGGAVVLLTPLPFVFYFTKFGRFKGGALFGASLLPALLILNFFNPNILFPLLFFIFAGATGIMLSEILRKSWSIEKTLTVPVVILLICSGFLLLLHAFQADETPWRLIENYTSTIVQENITLYEQLDVASEQIIFIKDHAGQIAALLADMFPAIMVVGASLIIGINLWAARFLFQRHGLYYPDFGDLTGWKAPERLVWLFIAAAGMLFIPSAGVKVAGMNLLIICLYVYLFSGLSIIGYLFKVKRVSVLFRVLFYVLFLMQQYLLLFVAVIGLFDLWADFRKWIKPAQNSGV